MRPEDITQWEYTDFDFESTEYHKISEELRELGINGWECYCVTNDDRNMKKFYLKRPRVSRIALDL